MTNAATLLVDGKLMGMLKNAQELAKHGETASIREAAARQCDAILAMAVTAVQA